MSRWNFPALTAATMALVVMSAAVVRAGESETVPFTYRSGLIWVPVQVAGWDRPLSFLLDSGAEQSILDLGTARKLGIRFVGREGVTRVGRSEIAFQTAPVRVRLGERITWSAPMLALDLQADSRNVSRHIDGLLGIDFIRGRTLQIDYPAQVLRFDPPKNSLRGRSVPITLHRGNPCLKLRVGESHLLPQVRIDTGCNQALHWSMVLPEGAPKPGSRAIGFSSTRTRPRKSDVVLGPALFRDVRTTLHPRPIFPGEQGLLGNLLLAQFGTVTLDVPNRRLILGEH